MVTIYSIIDQLNIKLLKTKEQKRIFDFRISLKINNEIIIYIVSNNGFPDLSDITKNNENITIEKISQEDIEFDIYYDDIFNKNQDTIIYKDSRKRFTSLLNSEENNYNAPCPVITFYSYKGGLGRSTALACYATYIAQHKKSKVFIIDCDFEAPGFTNFFLDKPYFPNNYNGFIEYINDKEFFNTQISLNKYIWEVSKDYTGEGEIRIMPAGNLDDSEYKDSWLEFDRQHYIEGLARLDINSSNYIISKFRDLINEIYNQYKPDTILIDSRTGFTDIFGLTAVGLSNLAVGFFGNSVQNKPGLHFFIDFINNVKKENFTGIIVNPFSRRKLFEHFVDEIENYINSINAYDDLQLDLKKFYLGRNDVLERVGTIEEDKDEFIKFIQYRESKEYCDLFEYIYEISVDIRQKPKENINNDRIGINEIITNQQVNLYVSLKKEIIKQLHANWAQLYAEKIEDYNKEYVEQRYFYRKCMLDIFNLNRFLILGNKGTGKSYIYQSLKNESIVNELKKRANKNEINYLFFHLIDYKEKLFFNTENFDNEKIEKTDWFYRRFWFIYTWKAIMQIAGKKLGYKTNIPIPILTETETKQNYLDLISNDEKFIQIEKDLEQFDNYLNSLPNTYIIIVFDDLDVIVKPHLWSERIAPLLNFWKRNPFNRIIPKLFVRRDLFNKISGLTNIKELENQAISIEWTNEELFAYFFKLVFSKTRNELFELLKLYNEVDKKAISIIRKNSEKDNQPILEYGHLRILCEAFFGKYPDHPRFGESYEWIFKNLQNADGTISLRPFIDLLGFAISEAIKDDETERPILPPKYYTNKQGRIKAVKNHFDDLAGEKGNTDLQLIFDFIDKNSKFQYYEFTKFQIDELFQNIINQENKIENKTPKDLLELLKVNGIIQEKNYGNIIKYSFAFLYKYRLGLKDRRKDRKYKK